MYSGNFKEGGGSTVAKPLHQIFKIKLNHTPYGKENAQFEKLDNQPLGNSWGFSTLD